MPIPQINQLRRALNISEQIERLQSQLASLFGGRTSAPQARKASTADSGGKPGRNRRRMSAAARAKIAEAQRRRWAKQKGTGALGKKAKPTKAAAAAPKKRRKGGITPAGRAKLAAMMKARWAARKKGASA
jgi:hypothetical protein